MEKGKFDLERELRAGSRPSAEFVTSLAGDVRGRVRGGRIGLTLALCGLIVIAVTSFGGLGYAAGNKPTVLRHNSSSASAQYQKFTPKQTQAKVEKSEDVLASPPATAAQTLAAPPKVSSQLPFTGLALWVPLAIGLVLVGFGVLLSTRARRRGSRAH